MEEIRFDNEIYSVRAIETAIKDYSFLAKISLTFDDTERISICTIFNCKYSLEKTKLEFANYVLELSIRESEK